MKRTQQEQSERSILVESATTIEGFEEASKKRNILTRKLSFVKILNLVAKYMSLNEEIGIKSDFEGRRNLI